MKEPSEMTPAQLRDAIDRVKRQASLLCARMINEGKGHYRFTDVEVAVERGTTDPTLLEYAANSARHIALMAERNARRSYSGTLQRIPAINV